MYAPSEEDIDAVYAAETKIYRIKKRQRDNDEPNDEDLYDPHEEKADEEPYIESDDEAFGEDNFSENEAYFDEAYYDELKRKQKVRRKKGRLSRSQRGLIVAITVIYVLVLLLAAWLVFYRPSQPGGHEVPFDTNPGAPTEQCEYGGSSAASASESATNGAAEGSDHTCVARNCTLLPTGNNGRRLMLSACQTRARHPHQAVRPAP